MKQLKIAAAKTRKVKKMIKQVRNAAAKTRKLEKYESIENCSLENETSKTKY